MDAGKRASPRAAAAVRILLYALVVLTPGTLATILHPRSHGGYLYQVGLFAALTGFTIVGMQFVLAARWRWVEWPFGLDMIFRFHKFMGLTAGVLIVAHPLLLAGGSGAWGLLYRLDMPWQVWLGRTALVLLLIHAALALWTGVFRLGYQRWFRVHNAGALLVAAVAFAHSFFMPRLTGSASDLYPLPMRVLWVAALVVVLASWSWITLIRPAWRKRRAYRVAEVRDETPDVHTVRFVPPPGQERMDYLPGQFHFLKFYRRRGPGPEEHHWTISSSPTEEALSSTIKESGDYTGTIGLTQPDDRVAVYGPYGRFSYLLHPEQRDLVFIAGGIGITPLRAMLRHMADTEQDMRVTLLYANRTQRDIAFRAELEAIAAGPWPELAVVHVLSRPEEDWTGQRGHVTGQTIRKYAGADLQRKAYYVCCPPGMTETVLQALREFRVPPGQVHLERFWLK